MTILDAIWAINFFVLLQVKVDHQLKMHAAIYLVWNIHSDGSSAFICQWIKEKRNRDNAAREVLCLPLLCL